MRLSPPGRRTHLGSLRSHFSSNRTTKESPRDPEHGAIAICSDHRISEDSAVSQQCSRGLARNFSSSPRWSCLWDILSLPQTQTQEQNGDSTHVTRHVCSMQVTAYRCHMARYHQCGLSAGIKEEGCTQILVVVLASVYVSKRKRPMSLTCAPRPTCRREPPFFLCFFLCMSGGNYGNRPVSLPIHIPRTWRQGQF